MKKLFTLFVASSTVASFAACGKKNDAKASSPKETKSEIKTKSNSSPLVKSSTRNQYLRKGHEEWIADSLKTIAPKLKDNQEYKTAFKDWMDTSNAQVAKIEAYSKSDDFEQGFTTWKGGKEIRTKEEFVDQIALSTTTASYKIYETWIQSNQGESEMKSLYKQGVLFYDNKYRDWANKMSKKSSKDYADDPKSDPVFFIWVRSVDAKNDLEAIYKGDGSYYQDGYNTWKALPENQKARAQYANSKYSDAAFATWVRSDSGKSALSQTFKMHSDGVYQRKHTTWKATNINQGSYEASSDFVDDLVEWAKTKKTNNDQDVKRAFISALQSGSSPGDLQLQAHINPLEKIIYENSSNYRDDISVWAYEKWMIPSTPQDVANSVLIRKAFKKAMESSSPFGDKALKDAFEEWKSPSHSKYRTSYGFNGHFGEFLEQDTTRSEDVVKNKIKAIVESSSPTGGNLDLKNAFIAWQPTSKENFVKSEIESSKFTTWSDDLSEVDPIILDEISKMLQDKDLFTKTKGNSEFVKSLKQITNNSYDSYVLTL